MSFPTQGAKEKKGMMLEIKSIDENEGIVEGYASTFGNVDYDFDRMMPGAYKKTIQENPHFPILADHMASKPIGVNKLAMEDDKGLYTRQRYDIKNNQLAKERFSFIKMCHEEQTKANFSVGFITIKAEPDRDNPTIRNILEVKLMEVSHVVFPANPEANSMGVKFMEENFDDQEVAISVSRFINHLKEKGYSDEAILKAWEAHHTKYSKPSDGKSLAHLFEKYGNPFS